VTQIGFSVFTEKRIIMTDNRKQGFIKKQGLTQVELSEIEVLAALCNSYEGLELKLNWNILRNRPAHETNDFLYYDNRQLVGYLALFSFNSKEAEIGGMVHPDYRRRGIFTTLLSAAKDECQQRRVPKLLLIVEHASLSGQAFAAWLHPGYDHTEYRMALEEARIPPVFNTHLHFRRARLEDAPMLAHITAVSFDIDEKEINGYNEHVMDASDRRYYVATLGDSNTYIGKIDVSLNKHEAVIYGFGVLPQYRGRGYGRQMLMQTIQDILAIGQHHMVLEVATQNKNALSLYQSCGFRETGSYDYYSLEV
jgi:ribosomal protein S18 acetylase RimI-like enzyme